MATLKLNTKTLATQTSSAEPVIATGVTGSPTIALTNATGTMPNGTQDNITRLGTVTVGNLSNSAIVYPAGHVVQTVSAVYHDVNGSTTATTAGQRVSAADTTITPLFASSDILIEASFGAYSSGGYGTYDFYKNASDVTETYNLSGEGYGIAPHTGQTKWFHTHMVYLDTCSENSLSEKTYSLSFWTSGSAGTTYGGWGGGSVIQITAKEIKR